MVNLPPDSDEQRRSRNSLSFEEFIAVIVAFLAIGSILLWGLTRGGAQNWAALNFADPPLDLSGSQEPTDQDSGVLTDPDAEPGTDPEAATRSPRETQQQDNGVSVVPPVGGVAVVPVGPQDERVVTSGTTEAPAEPVPEAPLAAAPNVPERPFNVSDVPPDHWAYPFISTLYTAGYLAEPPDGQFRPDQPMTRAEMAALLNASFVTGATSGPSFTDVPSDYWAKEAIDQVVGAGYMRGFPEGDFQPAQPVPRHQVLVTLASGLGLEPSAYSQELLSRFSDSGDLPEWARGRVAVATAEGLVVNHPDPALLRPNQPATRAEIVAMMHQALAAQGLVDDVESPYIIPALQ